MVMFKLGLLRPNAVSSTRLQKSTIMPYGIILSIDSSNLNGLTVQRPTVLDSQVSLDLGANLRLGGCRNQIPVCAILDYAVNAPAFMPNHHTTGRHGFKVNQTKRFTRAGHQKEMGHPHRLQNFRPGCKAVLEHHVGKPELLDITSNHLPERPVAMKVNRQADPAVD